MKILPLVLIIITAPSLVSEAGVSSGWSSGGSIVIAAPEPRKVGVSLILPAELVSVPLRISSDQKDTALAYEESRKAIDTIAAKIKENGQFRISSGVVTLSQRQSSFGISSGYWSQPAASAEIFILVPLTNDRPDIFAAGAEAARFIEGLHLPGKVHCELGQLQLAVENPEQYRGKLLDLIAQEARNTRNALTVQGSLTVHGLESSVMVRQADDRQIELYLNYTLSVTSEK